VIGAYTSEELRSAARRVRAIQILHDYQIAPPDGVERPGPTILNMSEAEEVVKAVWGIENA
jgi:hypothetical protein